MSSYTDKSTANPALEDFASALEQVLHKGAQDMLQLAIKTEVQQYLEKKQPDQVTVLPRGTNVQSKRFDSIFLDNKNTISCILINRIN